jgi:uncharacterized protein
MNFNFLNFASTTAISCVFILATGACRKRSPKEVPMTEVSQSSSSPSSIPDELKSNQLGSLPSAVYRTQVQSPIHWQPWTKETMERARSANRLIFAVIALPQQSDFQYILTDLASDPALLTKINESYVPVLIDGDASREIGQLTVDLCAEIKSAVRLPLFVWMTPDANPVAWIPSPMSQSTDVSELFNQSESMISRMWLDDPNYVLKNSIEDNANRRARISIRKNTKVMSQDPSKDTLASLRQLTSLYDPDSRSFDLAGGLFPSGSIDLLATAAIQPGLPADLRTRCLKTTRELMVDLLLSAMFDPLDGGIFSARWGTTWSFPTFTRDCVSQSRAAVSLINCYRATGDDRVLEKALQIIDFVEKSYLTPEGLFSVGLTGPPKPANWLWTIEDIKKALPAADVAWWIKATNMKEVGNLPGEMDQNREFLRSNSLGMVMTLSEIAASQSQSLEAFKPRYQSACEKLLQVRNNRIGQSARDDCSHAGSSFRMASAYVAAFGVTGHEKYRIKAITLMEKCRAAFSDGPQLRLFSKDAPKSIGAGRAFLYGLALQASLDVSVIDPEKKWTDWSEDIATTSAELFTGSEFLKECPDDAKIIDLPITDLIMVFDDSTAGLFAQAECRLAERGRPLVGSFSKLATPLPNYTVDQPLIHTDLLLATLARYFKVTIVSGANLSSELRLATQRLPMRSFQYRMAASKNEVPDGSVMVVFGDGQTRVISSVAALQQAVLPSP